MATFKKIVMSFVQLLAV